MRYLTFLFYFVFFISCVEEKIDETDNAKINNEVLIIVNNPNSLKTNIGTGIDVLLQSRLDWNTIKKIDTIHLPVTTFKKLYLRNDRSQAMIICKAGDTLLINIEMDKLNHSFANRELKKYDSDMLLVEYLKRELQPEYNTYNSYQEKMINTDDFSGAINLNIDYIKNNQIEYKEHYTAQNVYLNKKILLLKKLYNTGLISDTNYNYQLAMTKYEDYSSLLDHLVVTGDEFYQKSTFQNYLEQDSIVLNDFISYGYINSMITKLILKGKQQIVIDANSANTFIDYGMAFDSLSNYVSGNLLKYSQLICLYEMSKNRPRFKLPYFDEKLEQYYSINSKVENPKTNTFITTIENDYLVDLSELVNDSDEFNFITIHKDNYNLNQILEENKGKIIYMNFWASWCTPCRAVIPDAEKLSNDFKNRNVSFIYISIDKDFKKWVEAQKEENVFAFNRSFLAVNYPKADFYENLNLTTIPRYLLFDKEGTLVEQDAPGPNDQEIRNLLDKYLVE